MLRSHVPDTAIVPHTSNIRQYDMHNDFALSNGRRRGR